MITCINCNASIPPSWVHALNSGVCPGCGNSLFSDEQKELLSEMKLALEQMDHNPECIVSWLFANYSIRKIGTAEPTTFHRKAAKVNRPPVEKIPTLKIAHNPMQEFLKRANSPKKPTNYADIVAEINNGIVDDPYGNGVPLEVEMDEEAITGDVVEEGYSYDENDEAVQEALYNRANFKSKTNKLARHSITMPGSKPLTPQQTMAMMEAVSNSGPADLGEELPEALQIARIDRLKKQNEMVNGTGGGVFRRGG